jgi:lipopolysaccharide transport system ATP-binding protein
VASLLEVGTGFHPELSGRENIFLNGAILGMTKAEIKSKFDEIVAFSEVEKFLDTPVKHYSSGMYVRLAFAVAAHLDPEILIVDEVLAVGDAQFQKKCLGKMKDVAGAGRTVLFVSHNMAAVGALCSRAVLLKAGRVEKTDTADNVISYYFDTTTTRHDSDPARMRLPGFGDQIRFVSVSMAEHQDILDYDAPIRVEMAIHSDRDFEGLSIGASVFNHFGDTVGTLFTSDTFSIRRGETRTICLTVKTPRLAPGNYYLGQSIGTGGIASERFDYEIVIGVPAFTVMPRGEAGMLATWQRTWGSVCFPDTRLEPVDTPAIA